MENTMHCKNGPSLVASPNNDNDTSSNHEDNSISERASRHPTNTEAKEVPRRKKSPQRVDMTGNVAIASELEDFNNRFQNVLQAQGYTGLSLQPGEVPLVTASGNDNGDDDDDDDSSTVFNYYESVVNERAIPVGTEDTSPSDEEGSRNYTNNKNKKLLSNSKTGSVNDSKTGDRGTSANKVGVGIGDGGDLPIINNSLFRREPKESRLVKRKQHVGEIQRLNKAIGALTESLRGSSSRGVGGNNTNTIGKSRESNTRCSESGASVSFVRRAATEDSALPTKSVEELISEESSSMHSSVPTTTTTTLTYTPQPRESFDTEVATGGPMEDEDYVCDHDKSAVSIVLNATTSTCSSGKNTGGTSAKEKYANAKKNRKFYTAGIILAAVLGMTGLGMYLGFMSYMIRANNQL